MAALKQASLQVQVTFLATQRQLQSVTSFINLAAQQTRQLKPAAWSGSINAPMHGEPLAMANSLLVQ